jgi:hypothetical protein
MAKKNSEHFHWFKCFGSEEMNSWSKAHWSAEQWGWFHRLRCFAFAQEPRGKLPTKDEVLASLAKRAPKYSRKAWKEVLGEFRKKGNGLWLPDLLKEAREKRHISEIRAAAGKKGGEARKLSDEETLLWRGISWPEWALKKLRLEVGCESDALKVEIDSLPDLRQTNPKKAAKLEAEKALYRADLKIMDLCAKTIDDVLAHPAEHRGQGKVKVTWGGKEWYPSELVEKITQNRLLSAAQSVGRKDTNIVRVKSSLANLEIRSIYVALQVVEDQSELNLRPDKQPSASRSVAVGVPGKSKKTRELPPDIQEQIDAAKRSLAA